MSKELIFTLNVQVNLEESEPNDTLSEQHVYLNVDAEAMLTDQAGWYLRRLAAELTDRVLGLESYCNWNRRATDAPR